MGTDAMTSTNADGGPMMREWLLAVTAVAVGVAIGGTLAILLVGTFIAHGLGSTWLTWMFQ